MEETEIIETLIAQAASTNAPEDYDALFFALSGTHVFFNLEAVGEGPESGAPASASLFAVGPCQRAVRFFASRNNRHLRRPFAGIVWEEALEMIANIPQADGLVIQSNAAGWVGVNKAKVLEMLAAL
jgi:hypothetical protein